MSGPLHGPVSGRLDRPRGQGNGRAQFRSQGGRPEELHGGNHASGIKNFKKAQIDDPATYFKGKTIQATGLIRMVKKQYQIVIDDPEMIKVVEKK
jgi:hypothetical protein